MGQLGAGAGVSVALVGLVIQWAGRSGAGMIRPLLLYTYILRRLWLYHAIRKKNRIFSCCGMAMAIVSYRAL